MDVEGLHICGIIYIVYNLRKRRKGVFACRNVGFGNKYFDREWQKVT